MAESDGRMDEWQGSGGDLPPRGGSRILIMIGVAGTLINVAGWVLYLLKVIPHYPYMIIAMAFFLIYFAGRGLPSFMKWWSRS